MHRVQPVYSPWYSGFSAGNTYGMLQNVTVSQAGDGPQALGG